MDNLVFLLAGLFLLAIGGGMVVGSFERLKHEGYDEIPDLLFRGIGTLILALGGISLATGIVGSLS